MTTAQKIIKYFALAFAAFLIISIMSGIITAFYGISTTIGIINNKEVSNIDNIMQGTNFENSNIATLNINVAYTTLTIKTGEYLKAETNNSNINCKQNGNKIEIKEKSDNWFLKNNDEELIVYIPENLTFEKVDINAGAGKVNIEKLNTKQLSFELGAGKVEINQLNVFDNGKIEGGAGKLEVLSGSIKDLELDMGVGETNISSKIIGNSKINAGVGSLNININGQKEDYKIKTSKGLGSIRINNKEVSNNQITGDGENYIQVEGGIGSINIKFE